MKYEEKKEYYKKEIKIYMKNTNEKTICPFGSGTGNLVIEVGLGLNYKI